MADLSVSRWLEAHCDRSAGLMTLPRNVILVDVVGDGNYRLVLTDIKLNPDQKSRVKIYKDTLLTSDQILPSVPSSLVSFYTDHIHPRLPVVATACDADLLIYKNNKPFYKFSVPSSPLNPLEEDLWKKLETANANNIADALLEFKAIPFSSLTPRSQQLLLQPPEKALEYASTHLTAVSTKKPPITCMATINKSSQDKHAVGCPILGTETGQLYILDPQSFTVLHQANTCSAETTPFIIRAVGILNVDFRIVVACRDKNVCLLRKDWLEGKSIIQLTEHIVDLEIVPGDGFIMVATSEKMLHCYTKRGLRLWSTVMVNFITCLCLIPLKHLSTHLVAVGLRNGYIHLYHGRHAVDFITCPDTPSAIAFGQLGQEEQVLVIITLDGTINFKILKRTADFNLSKQDKLASGTPSLQSKPLPLPKRSKLFMEQSQREQLNAIDMHQNYQQDLIRLRLTAARALVQNLGDQSGTANESEQIKLSAQVLGLGPNFTLILTIENINTEKAATNLFVVFHAKPTVYVLSEYNIEIPLIPPSLFYKVETKVTEVKNEEPDSLNGNQTIKVFVLRKGQSQPILAATINMPPTEDIFM